MIHWADDDGVFNAGQLLTGTIEVFLILKKNIRDGVSIVLHTVNTVYTLWAFTKYGSGWTGWVIPLIRLL